jgi:hypothetical protein
MKKCFLFLSLSLVFLSIQASVKLTGTISKYKISMELVASTASKDYNVRGRYNYDGKTQSLDLKGNMFGGSAIYLTESFGGKETGEFYLEQMDGHWSGSWLGNGKRLACDLYIKEGSSSELEAYDLSELNANCSGSITGSYASENYYINDFHYSEDTPELEIGFGGGYVTVKEISRTKIEFSLQQTCGPNYHLAYASGEAALVSPGKYLYETTEYQDDEPCKLTLIFKDKSLSVSQGGSDLACGFGASAYAEGGFDKVSDRYVESDDLSMDDILKK